MSNEFGPRPNSNVSERTNLTPAEQALHKVAEDIKAAAPGSPRHKAYTDYAKLLLIDGEYAELEFSETPVEDEQALDKRRKELERTIRQRKRNVGYREQSDRIEQIVGEAVIAVKGSREGITEEEVLAKIGVGLGNMLRLTPKEKGAQSAFLKRR